MRIRHSGPIDWPSQAQWDERARAALDAEELPPIDDAGRVVLEEDMPADLQIVLVAGEHGQPGARYELREPTLTRGAVTCHITGSSVHPTVELAYREPNGAAATLRLDGLGRVRSLHAASDLPHLDLRVHASPSAPEVLRVRLRLDWLRADLRVDIRRGRARVRGQVRGVWMWRPMLAPVWLIMRLRGNVGAAVHRQVVAIATGEGGERAAVEREVHQALRSEARIRTWLHLRDVLETAIREVDSRPWYRREAAAWHLSSTTITSRVALWRDPDTPADLLHTGIGWKEIDALVKAIGTAPHPERPLLVDALVSERIAEEHRLPRPAVDRAGHDPVAVDADAWADLRWLRSPVTILRHVLTQTRGPDAKPVSLWRPWSWMP